MVHHIIFLLILVVPLRAIGLVPLIDRCDLAYALLGKDAGQRQQLLLTFFAEANPPVLEKSQRNDNRNYLTHLEKGYQPNVLYLHLALKVMKPLNDRVFAAQDGPGKEGVNAVRNLFRLILTEQLKSEPDIWNALMHQYVDFKSMEFPFDKTKIKDEAQFERSLAGAVRDAQIEFESLLLTFFNNEPKAMEGFLREHGIVSDLRAWHTLGFADGHPDLAATAARFAPRRFDREKSTPLNPVKNDEAKAATVVEEVEQQRLALAKALGATAIMAKYGESGPLVLSHGAIDILRQVKAGNQEEYISSVTAEFQRVLKVKLTKEQVLLLRDYFTQTDFFQPNIRGEERTEIRLGGGRFGVQSVDFASQNVFNFFHTMGALAQAHQQGLEGSPMGRQAVLNARANEALATERLTDLKTRYDRTRSEFALEGKYQLSGDDGVIELQKPVTRASQEALYLSLMRQGGVADFRMVFVEPSKNPANNADSGKISSEIVQGEGLEKAIRKSLRGSFPPELLAQIAFPVHINPDTHAMEVYVVGPLKGKALADITGAVRGFTPPEGYKITQVTTLTGP